MTERQYIRKYQILVSDKNNNALDVSDLTCNFEIERKAIQAIQYADITIYNLSPESENALIKEGHRVIVKAGYEDGDFGTIFDGEVFQPIWDRENVVDRKLTLHCIDGDASMHGNFASFVQSKGYNHNDIIAAMANNARSKIPLGKITGSLKTEKAPRGKVIFGDPRDVLSEITTDNNGYFFMNGGNLEVMKITDVPQGEALVISPETGLIGTPQQIDYGFSFKCLLNPSIRVTNPCMMVKLNNTSIRQNKATQNQMVSRLDLDMYGIVIAVTYIGGTRSQDWHCIVTCLNRGGKIPLGLGEAQIPEFVRNEMERTD